DGGKQKGDVGKKRQCEDRHVPEIEGLAGTGLRPAPHDGLAENVESGHAPRATLKGARRRGKQNARQQKYPRRPEERASRQQCAQVDHVSFTDSPFVCATLPEEEIGKPMRPLPASCANATLQ